MKELADRRRRLSFRGFGFGIVRDAWRWVAYTRTRMKPPSLRQSFVSRSAVLLTLSFVASAQTTPEEILLKDYKPRSIFKIPETRVEKARYAVVDVHSHDYAPTAADVDRWVQTMNEVGLEETIILLGPIS